MVEVDGQMRWRWEVEAENGWQVFCRACGAKRGGRRDWEPRRMQVVATDFTDYTDWDSRSPPPRLRVSQNSALNFADRHLPQSV